MTSPPSRISPPFPHYSEGSGLKRRFDFGWLFRDRGWRGLLIKVSRGRGSRLAQYLIERKAYRLEFIRTHLLTFCRRSPWVRQESLPRHQIVSWCIVGAVLNVRSHESLLLTKALMSCLASADT